MLQLVRPYVAWGYPNLKTVKELVYKRGYGKLDKQRVAISDNSVIEAALGKQGVVVRGQSDAGTLSRPRFAVPFPPPPPIILPARARSARRTSSTRSLPSGSTLRRPTTSCGPLSSPRRWAGSSPSSRTTSRAARTGTARRTLTRSSSACCKYGNGSAVSGRSASGGRDAALECLSVSWRRRFCERIARPRFSLPESPTSSPMRRGLTPCTRRNGAAGLRGPREGLATSGPTREARRALAASPRKKIA